MIDRIVRSSPTRRVIELAVGLSRRGATLSADPTFDYIEIDVPHVIAHKRRLLERSAAGRVVLARPNLQLVAGDVLVDALPARTPAVVVAEGLAMYLAGDARRALFARVRALGDVELVFDLTPASDEPPPGAIGRALERAMKRFTGGQAFERDARTRDDVVAELGAAGFADARAIAARDVARDWQLPFADRATPVVIFVARATRS